jgi:hypothetical protein
MGKAMSLRAGCAAGLLMGLGLALTTSPAEARVSTNLPGSILIFPKVINQGAQDSAIQITNTSNLTRHVRCFYIDGSAGPDGRPRWQVTDFNLTLTRQQPTHWLASRGRAVDPVDEGLAEAGLDPGSVPPVPPGFTGSLTCVEVDEGASPSGGDSLKGEATVGGLGTGATGVSKYNGIAIPAGPGGPDVAAATRNELLLNDDEYSGCPQAAHLNFAVDGAQDTILPPISSLISSTTLTFVPCSADFERLIPTRVSLAFDIRDEFEFVLSTSTTIECWGAFSIADTVGDDITPGFFGSNFGYARVTSVPIADPNAPVQGFVGVANVLRADSAGNLSTAATNLHFADNSADTNTDAGVIRLSDQ